MNRRGFLKGLLATATIALVSSPSVLPGFGVARVETFDEVMARRLKAYTKVMIDKHYATIAALRDVKKQRAFSPGC